MNDEDDEFEPANDFLEEYEEHEDVEKYDYAGIYVRIYR